MLIAKNFSRCCFAYLVSLSLFAFHATRMNKACAFKPIGADKGVYRSEGRGWDCCVAKNSLYCSVREGLFSFSAALAENHCWIERMCECQRVNIKSTGRLCARTLLLADGRPSRIRVSQVWWRTTGGNGFMIGSEIPPPPPERNYFSTRNIALALSHVGPTLPFGKWFGRVSWRIYRTHRGAPLPYSPRKKMC